MNIPTLICNTTDRGFLFHRPTPYQWGRMRPTPACGWNGHTFFSTMGLWNAYPVAMNSPMAGIWSFVDYMEKGSTLFMEVEGGRIWFRVSHCWHPRDGMNALETWKCTSLRDTVMEVRALFARTYDNPASFSSFRALH